MSANELITRCPPQLIFGLGSCELPGEADKVVNNDLYHPIADVLVEVEAAIWDELELQVGGVRGQW